MLTKLAKSAFRVAGLKVSRIANEPEPAAVPDSPFSELSPRSLIDLDRHSAMAMTIPGMVKARSGEILFSLCLLQSERGDVVEIGSWQGRSTSYLARAVEQSGNGRMYAVDHFRGNVGKESSYVVGRSDLSDLRNNFDANIARIGLNDDLTLLDMPSEHAAQQLADAKIRFLFIDGDHTLDGVQRDVALFFPMLSDGAIVAFDDYCPRFPGVVATVNKLLGKTVAAFAYQNTAVLKF